MLVYGLAYLANAAVGSVFVAFILDGLSLVDPQKSDPKKEGIKGAGMIIGVLERTLVLTLMFLDQPAAIAMIFAAKSIIRFQESSNRAFAEYYLVGTMSSIVFAVFVGIASSFILDMLTKATICL